MKIVKCDICDKDITNEDYVYDLDLGLIADSSVRILFDCDICNDCYATAKNITYSAIKTHLYNNIKKIRRD